MLGKMLGTAAAITAVIVVGYGGALWVAEENCPVKVVKNATAPGAPGMMLGRTLWCSFPAAIVNAVHVAVPTLPYVETTREAHEERDERGRGRNDHHEP